MEFFQVTIGMNIGGTRRPMTDQKWQDFIFAVSETVRVWSGQEPQVLVGFDVHDEEIAVITVCDTHLPPREDIGRTLTTIGGTYHQNYVVVASGYSHRVTTTPDPYYPMAPEVRRSAGRHAAMA